MTRDKPLPDQHANSGQLVNRLDTISLLIQGNDVCGSASFDGEKLLLATNKTEQSSLITNVKEFFTFVARKGKEIERHPEKEEAIRKEITDKTDQMVEAQRSQAGTQPQNAEDYRTSLNKITKSILATYIEPHYRDALTKDFSAAIAERQYHFINGEEGAHAEMKIAGRLLETNKVHDKPVIVGVSRRCCENCGHMIEAINEVKGQVKGGSIREVIAVQEEGTPLTINTRIPEFLRSDSSTLPLHERKAIEVRFLQKSGFSSLEAAYTSPPKLEAAAPEVMNLLHDIHPSKAQNITKDSHLTPMTTPTTEQPAKPAPVLTSHSTMPHKKP